MVSLMETFRSLVLTGVNGIFAAPPLIPSVYASRAGREDRGGGGLHRSSTLSMQLRSAATGENLPLPNVADPAKESRSAGVLDSIYFSGSLLRAQAVLEGAVPLKMLMPGRANEQPSTLTDGPDILRFLAPYEREYSRYPGYFLIRRFSLLLCMAVFFNFSLLILLPDGTEVTPMLLWVAMTTNSYYIVNILTMFFRPHVYIKYWNLLSPLMAAFPGLFTTPAYAWFVLSQGAHIREALPAFIFSMMAWSSYQGIPFPILCTVVLLSSSIMVYIHWYFEGGWTKAAISTVLTMVFSCFVAITLALVSELRLRAAYWSETTYHSTRHLYRNRVRVERKTHGATGGKMGRAERRKNRAESVSSADKNGLKNLISRHPSGHLKQLCTNRTLSETAAREVLHHAGIVNGNLGVLTDLALLPSAVECMEEEKILEQMAAMDLEHDNATKGGVPVAGLPLTNVTAGTPTLVTAGTPTLKIPLNAFGAFAEGVMESPGRSSAATPLIIAGDGTRTIHDVSGFGDGPFAGLARPASPGLLSSRVHRSPSSTPHGNPLPGAPTVPVMDSLPSKVPQGERVHSGAVPMAPLASSKHGFLDSVGSAPSIKELRHSPASLSQFSGADGAPPLVAGRTLALFRKHLYTAARLKSVMATLQDPTCSVPLEIETARPQPCLDFPVRAKVDPDYDGEVPGLADYRDTLKVSRFLMTYKDPNTAANYRAHIMSKAWFYGVWGMVVRLLSFAALIVQDLTITDGVGDELFSRLLIVRAVGTVACIPMVFFYWRLEQRRGLLMQLFLYTMAGANLVMACMVKQEDSITFIIVIGRIMMNAATSDWVQFKGCVGLCVVMYSVTVGSLFAAGKLENPIVNTLNLVVLVVLVASYTLGELEQIVFRYTSLASFVARVWRQQLSKSVPDHEDFDDDEPDTLDDEIAMNLPRTL